MQLYEKSFYSFAFFSFILTLFFWFYRIKVSSSLEVEVICSVLPKILTDFFPASDLLSKVIGEFLSPYQPHPHCIANIVFKVSYILDMHLSAFFENFRKTESSNEKLKILLPKDTIKLQSTLYKKPRNLALEKFHYYLTWCSLCLFEHNEILKLNILCTKL